MAASEGGAGFQAVNEIHLQYGKLKNPVFEGGGEAKTFTVTWQHASRWRYGDSFFFVDQQNPEGGGSDIYTEAYTNIALGRLTGKSLAFGPIVDMGPRIGINWGADDNIRRYLTGWRLYWKIPGFKFVNTDFFAFFDDSPGFVSGGALRQSTTWQGDINWNSKSIRIGEYRFTFEGHVEYTGARRNEFGNRGSWSLLGQPQFRFDLGDAVFDRPNKLFAGVELLIWLNKKGEAATDESRVQALVAWRF